MNTYEIEFSEQELKIFKEATKLGLGILTFNIDDISPTFEKKEEIKTLLGTIKKEVFGDLSSNKILNLFTKETRMRHHALTSLNEKLNNL